MKDLPTFGYDVDVTLPGMFKFISWKILNCSAYENRNLSFYGQLGQERLLEISPRWVKG